MGHTPANFFCRRPSGTDMTRRRHIDADIIADIEIAGRDVVTVVIAFDNTFSVMLGLVIELLTELQAVDVPEVFKERLSHFLPQRFGLRKGEINGLLVN